MDKKISGVSQLMSRFRGWIQAGAALLTNLHLPNFIKGGLYQGTGKTVCVPGLNCYSCPAASGACPIGAFQAVAGSSRFRFSYYVTGFLILLGVLLGRFICGFLCPFGWFQELLHKIPTKKLSTKKLKPLTYLKYVVLLVMVVLLPNFIKGGLYQGTGKTVCVPGLNCYSCPAASGACPIGAFQAVAGSSRFRFSYYVTGFLILLGVLLGRFICGFLCPFGWFQELLHKIPTKKLSTKKLKPLTYLKYVVLLVMVVLLPALVVNDVGMGDPFFCKYLCPQGVLEGAIPLSIANSGIRAALGSLFTWKFTILLGILVLSILFYRPFCKWLCPLGAFYALMNRVSLFQMKVDESKCVSCGKCAGACKMDVDVTKTPNHGECIRCGMCVRACPTGAVCFRYGFGDGKEAANETTKEAVNETTKKTTKKTNMEESK